MSGKPHKNKNTEVAKENNTDELQEDSISSTSFDIKKILFSNVEKIAEKSKPVLKTAKKRIKIIKIIARKKIKSKNINIKISGNKQKAVFAGLGSICVISMLVWSATHKNAQIVFVDEVMAGTIEDMDITSDEIYSSAIEKLKDETGTNVEVNENITLKPVHASKDEIASMDSVIDSVCDKFSYQVEAAVIEIDGSDTVILSSKEEAEKALQKVEENFVKDNTNITDTSFVENVNITSKYVKNNDVLNFDDAFTKLTSTKNAQKVRQIVEGDTLWDISIKEDITVDELLSANPGLTEESILKLGQNINLVVPVPVLSVRTVQNTVYTVAEPKPVETVENNSEYKTYKKVLQEGKDGTKEVTAKITSVNGIEQSREIINEKITVQPVAEKVEVGTLTVPPKKAVGTFNYPIRGRLSSGYGSRWGSTHKGIDLAAPAGTSIRASDGGTVIYSGYNSGGYGYLVQIDHGNGFITYYGHNSANLVSVGDKVAQGEVIAKVGSTGNSTGNHVHFEIRKNNVPMNPFDYLK